MYPNNRVSRKGFIPSRWKLVPYLIWDQVGSLLFLDTDFCRYENIVLQRSVRNTALALSNSSKLSMIKLIHFLHQVNIEQLPEFIAYFFHYTGVGKIELTVKMDTDVVAARNPGNNRV